MHSVVVFDDKVVCVETCLVKDVIADSDVWLHTKDIIRLRLFVLEKDVGIETIGDLGDGIEPQSCW